VIRELLRLPSPAPRPQALAFDGETLWMGSLETHRLYAIDPRNWTARDEDSAPGRPYGMTVVGDELYVICGIGPDDDREIRRYVPARGFTTDGAIGAPDGTGSQLAYDGDRLYVSQWYNKRILSLDERGNVGTVIDLPHEICGQVIVEGRFYCVCTDDETSGRYYLTRVDARGAKPVIEDLDEIRFDARALAYDGENFWTNHREANQIVAFARPDSSQGAS
jgi:hypothetical protein